MTASIVGDHFETPLSPTFQSRRDQTFPRLDPEEIQRLVRFGDAQSYADGQYLTRVGDPGVGLSVILCGAVQITRRVAGGKSEPIVVHEEGGFFGELAQLSGRPSLVDAVATGPVNALLISPRSLRAVLIAEADLGQKIMRALILRRVGLIESGSVGPVIIGPANDANVLRLEGLRGPREAGAICLVRGTKSPTNVRRTNGSVVRRCAGLP